MNHDISYAELKRIEAYEQAKRQHEPSTWMHPVVVMAILMFAGFCGVLLIVAQQEFGG